MTTVNERAARIRMVVLDIDGVMSDGTINVSGTGELYKSFYVRDGLGIKMLQKHGIEIAIITGRTSAIVAERMRELGVTRIAQGQRFKTTAYEALLEETGLTDEQVGRRRPRPAASDASGPLHDSRRRESGGFELYSLAVPLPRRPRRRQGVVRTHPQIPGRMGYTRAQHLRPRQIMIHRSLVLRERITAIVGAALLLLLVGASYYYSVQTRIEALKYVPSETSPDFTARRVTLTDFDERGVATARLSASTMEHFSDERMRATDASYHSLDPAKPQLALTGDRAWSNDNLETVELEGNVQLSRAPFKDEPDLFFTTEYIKGYLDTYRFETDRKVYMRRGIDTTEASNGMKYDNILHTVELDGSVVSVFHPNAQSTDTSANAAQK